MRYCELWILLLLGPAQLWAGVKSGVVPNGMISVFKWMTPDQVLDVTNGKGALDVAMAIDRAVATLNEKGGGKLYCPAGVYLLGTTSLNKNAFFSYVTAMDNVSIVGAGMDLTRFRIKGGENARFKGTTGPNAIATLQANPLTNCKFSDFTVDWNGSNNLLGPTSGARSNASIASYNGATNVTVERVKIMETPGNQGIFFPALRNQGQGHIIVNECVFLNNGSGLKGNQNDDHSSIYCNGSPLSYTANRFNAEQLVKGACFEIHGGDAVASGNVGDNYALGFWVASNYEPIKNIHVTNCSFTNMRAAFSVVNPVAKNHIDDVQVDQCSFRQKPDQKFAPGAYFINGNTLIACSRILIMHCTFVGQSSFNQSLLQQQGVEELDFIENEVRDFAQFGIVAAPVDMGGGFYSKSVSIVGNRFMNVLQPIFIYCPSLDLGYLLVYNNRFEWHAPSDRVPITINTRHSNGLIGANMFISGCLRHLGGDPKGICFVDATVATYGKTPVP